jgi:hypothetical protein
MRRANSPERSSLRHGRWCLSAAFPGPGPRHRFESASSPPSLAFLPGRNARYESRVGIPDCLGFDEGISWNGPG